MRTAAWRRLDGSRKSVRNTPGSTTVARMPRLVTSALSASVMPSTANFVDPYTPTPAFWVKPPTEPMFTM
jgi:hypothetical protein